MGLRQVRYTAVEHRDGEHGRQRAMEIRFFFFSKTIRLPDCKHLGRAVRSSLSQQLRAVSFIFLPLPFNY